MAQIAEWTCSICEKPNGKYFCYDCNQFLCDCCKDIHNKFPVNKHHTVIEAHLKVLTVSHECEKHKKNFLHYCQTCECLTCSECITSEHNRHAFRHVKDIADNARKLVSEAICNLKQNQSTMTNIKDEISVIDMSKIQSDTEKFTSKVSHLSHCLKGIIERVVIQQETFAFDFLALGKAQLKSYLAKLNKAFEDYFSLCKKLENVLLETHDATFYVNQAKLMKELNSLEIIPPIEKVEDLTEFSDEDFIDNVVNDIQVQHGISEFQRKDIEMQTLSDQLKHEEIINQETKKSFAAEREKMESAIQSKDIEIETLSGRLEQEELSHLKIKETIVLEQKKFETAIQSKDIEIEKLSGRLEQEELSHLKIKETIVSKQKKFETEIMSREMQVTSLSERVKQEEESHLETIESIIAERRELLIKLESTQDEINDHTSAKSVILKRKELSMELETAIKTISKRLKEEEISNKKLKEFIIAERIKNGTNLTLILFGLTWSGKSAREDGWFAGMRIMLGFSDAPFQQKYSSNYQGVTINIFESNGSQNNESYINCMYDNRKVTTKQDVVFLVNFDASNYTLDHIRRFDIFLKLSKQRNAKMVTAFTSYGKKLLYPFSNRQDDEKVHRDFQQITELSTTLSSKIQENNIKYIVIEHGHNFEIHVNQTQILSRCGFNIL